MTGQRRPTEVNGGQPLVTKPPPRVTLLLASRHCNLVSYLVPVSQKGRRRRHVATSYWTAASDVASTSAPVNDRSTACQRRSTTGQQPPDHRSTVVNGGGQRRSMVADHGSTTAGPLPEHRSTTARPPVNGGQRWWLTGSWAGSGQVLGRHVAPPEWATCHEKENHHTRQTWV
ncbi:hypothetical protein Tco_1382586 [Tanacetum coccineum]